MRDDTITVRGPFTMSDIYIEEYTDEDGTLVPAEVLDMAHVRRVEFESRACGCGQLHGYVLEINWDMVLGWPQFAEVALESGMQALVRAIEGCEAS